MNIQAFKYKNSNICIIGNIGKVLQNSESLNNCMAAGTNSNCFN